jgi:hypothetical protein
MSRLLHFYALLILPKIREKSTSFELQQQIIIVCIKNNTCQFIYNCDN